MPLPLLALATAALPTLAKLGGKLIGSKVGKAVGAAAIGAGAAALTQKVQGGQQLTSLPALPISAGSLPASMAVQTGQLPQAGGILPWWRGANNKLQMPWNDPNVPALLKQYALDDAYLRVRYYAPRGYVVIRDSEGRPYAIPRLLAQKLGLWRPAKKPPISASDWHHYKRNQQLEKKLIKICKPALKHHSRGKQVVVAKSHRKAS